MKKIDIRELKEIQLDILQCVHDFCQDNGLRYSLAYGTLIGAVRHHGYIPWDDDVDIMMPREDYEKFLLLFNGYKENIVVAATQLDRAYYAPYANVYNNKTLLIEHNIDNGGVGIKIDIFPIDSVPEDREKRIRLFNKVEYYKKIICLKNCNYHRISNLLSRIIAFIIQRFVSFISFSLLLDRLAYKQNNINNESQLINNIVWCGAGEKGCFPRSAMANYMEMKFESRSFKVIEGYDVFLKAHYGDYMKFPPEEDRVPQHGFEAYWK